MLIHYAKNRWVARCDGIYGDGRTCGEAAEGETAGAATRAAIEAGFRPLAGGRWACPDDHKKGVS